jgi:hypothetical protein
MGNMLGRIYKTIPRCHWYCCTNHSLNKATHKSSIKRARVREKREWMKREM